MSEPATPHAAAQTTIAHFMPWSGVGGVEIATLRLIAATRDRFRHIAFCLHDATELQHSFQQLGIPTFVYDPPISSIRHGLTYLRASQAIARMLRREHVDIVHFSDVKAAEHNSLAALLAGCRMVCHVRVSVPHVSLRTRLTLLPVRLFVFVSREAQQGFGIQLRANRTSVIYDAIEAPTFEPSVPAQVRNELGIAPGRPIVGMVARISPQKDHLTLARAAAIVLQAHPEALFLMVGDNANVPLNREHYHRVHATLHELGILDSFLFTGHRPDVFRLTSAMDFCVLPTHREGFPLSILETMAMRKAVIATAVGGIPEIIEPGVNGYLHPHEDSVELARYINVLLDNPHEAQAMGTHAMTGVRQNYAPAKYAEEVSAAYHDLLGNSKGNKSA